VLVLYDFQEDFKEISAGEFHENIPISVRGDKPTSAMVQDVEDVKSLLISNRPARESGIYINLKKISGLLPGDRITVTGRVGEGAPPGPIWSVALLSVDDGHLTHHISPRGIYSVSHVLELNELTQIFTIHTIGWGTFQPLMDLYIDSIIITRSAEIIAEERDTRTLVYTLKDDPNLEWVDTDDVDSFGDSLLVTRSGSPTIRIFKRDDAMAFHVDTRVNDWDGIDIKLEHMKLRTASRYKVIVTGRIDGDAQKGAIIMLQGVPNYAWRAYVPIKKDLEFNLEYILSRTETEKLKGIRVTTNPEGATVPFFIYSIEVIRV